MQVIISHRGNLRGCSPDYENSPDYICNALNYGFDVEIDVWNMPDGYYLGHAMPCYKIEYSFLENERLWIHCKNAEAFIYLFEDKKLNIFWHTEGIALTSKGFLFTAPGLITNEKSIAVMPEFADGWDLSKAYGVCTDYPIKYK